MSGKIGLSVSLCIASMASGATDPATVAKIVGGTRATTPATWEQVIDSYKRTSWRKFPAEAEALVRKFIAEGKIEQPRLLDSRRWPKHDKEHIFVNSESEITYYND